MKRRLLAVFMVLALLVGLMPMSALAAPGGDYNTRIELEGANYIGFDSGDTATVTINGQTYEETIRRDSGNYYVYLYISSNRNSVDGTIEVNGYTADVTVSMRYMSSYRYTGTVDWYDWQQPTDYDVYIYFGGNTGVERNDYVSVSVNGSESEIYQVERSSGRLRVHISDAVVGADREDVTATVTFGGQTATIGLSFEDNYYSDYYTGTVNGWNGGSDPGEDGTYDAYYYLRYPGEDEDSRDVSLFTYVGKGSVDSDIGAPNSWSNQGRTVAITPNNENWMTLPEPDTQETHTGGTMDGHGSYEVSHNTYPEITYEDETYYYAESDEGIANPEHTYTIDWYRYSSSTGYNIGNVSFGTNGYEGYTWHVDGYINFSDKYTVTYKVQFPEDSSYSDVKYDEGSGAWVESDEGPYVVYVDDTDNVTVGSIDNAPEMRKTVEESGTTYEFQGWYYDSACIDEVESGDVITEDTILYGKYVEDERRTNSTALR